MIKYFSSGLLRRVIILTENLKKGEKALKIVELCRVSKKRRKGTKDS